MLLCDVQIQPRLRQLEAFGNELQFRSARMAAQADALSVHSFDIADFADASPHATHPSAASPASSLPPGTGTLAATSAGSVTKPSTNSVGVNTSRPASAAVSAGGAASSSHVTGSGTPGLSPAIVAAASTGPDGRKAAVSHVMSVVAATQDDIARCIAIAEQNRARLLDMLADWTNAQAHTNAQTSRLVCHLPHLCSPRRSCLHVCVRVCARVCDMCSWLRCRSMRPRARLKAGMNPRRRPPWTRCSSRTRTAVPPA